MVGTSIVADIANDKFVYGLPLYRIEKKFLDKGINLSRYTMSNYLSTAYQITKPVIEAIGDYIKDCSICRSDETTLNIINTDNKNKSGSKKCYVWLFSSGESYHQAEYFKLGPTRSREVLTDFLKKDKKYYLLSDGYDAYKNVSNIINVYCLAHIRRKFAVLIDKRTPSTSIASQTVSKIAKIYHEDSMIKQLYSGNYEEIKKQRDTRVKPLCIDLFNYLRQFQNKLMKQSGLSIAIEYALKCEEGFMHVFDDGRLELDNNASERKIKNFVTGRKNWLFSNTEHGATCTCGMYTLVRTAIANNIKPDKYIKYLLDKLGCEPRYDARKLLPWSDEIKQSILKEA